jgi:four helix bundle protein
MLAHMKYAARMKYAAAYEGKFYFIAKQLHIRRILHIAQAILHSNVEVEHMRENKLADLSLDLSVKMMKLCDGIRGHYSAVNQMERATTSIAANIREANYAHGKADFIAKLQIALKESYEAEYWMELFVRAELVPGEQMRPLHDLCGTIRRILVASINTAKGERK